MRRRAVISLTPLIDVVFILLVFFMLASSFMEWRTLDLGVDKAGGGQGMKGAMLLELRPEGVRLSGEVVDTETLVERLSGRFAEDPEQAILIKPHADVPLQSAVALIDKIAAAGGRAVSFVDHEER